MQYSALTSLEGRNGQVKACVMGDDDLVHRLEIGAEPIDLIVQLREACHYREMLAGAIRLQKAIKGGFNELIAMASLR
ncbi:hypothetical protein [Bradyrhizobium sp. USDA 336]|uniref:hypothetical protein n=1 Tax=Bradyrhizobium sp. USDA 336 TaxID=3156311 RepID=UPI003835B793